MFNVEFVYDAGPQRHQFTPTLDRLIPAKGYVKGNVRVISNKANLIKSAYGSTDIAAVATWLSSEGH